MLIEFVLQIHLHGRLLAWLVLMAAERWLSE